MWKPGEGPEVENIDNYLAAIERAKADLEALNSSIADKREEYSNICSKNTEALKQAMLDIEDLKSKANTLSDEANKMHADAAVCMAELGIEHDKLEADKNSFAIEKEAAIKSLEDENNRIEQKWNDLKAISDSHDKASKELDDKITQNAALVSSMASETQAQAKCFEEVSAAALNIADKHEETKALKSDADAKLAEANDLMSKAKDMMLAAEALSKSSNELKVIYENGIENVKSQKTELVNIIIESKKASLEANTAKEEAKNQIAEANLKIAELSKLKEDLAKQEN